MLIIAIPKSASSSLLKTLSTLHGLKGIQDFSFAENRVPEKSNIIHTMHSDIRELNTSVVDRFLDEKIIFKQHIFPSKNNLSLLETKKKVILLRNPDHIVKSYFRGAKFNFNSLPEDSDTKMTEKQFRKNAKENGLYDDIGFFYNTWASRDNNEYTLVVHYEDYIKNTNKVVNKIEEFYGLPVTRSKINPVKARYAKISFFKRSKAYLKIMVVKLMRKIGLK